MRSLLAGAEFGRGTVGDEILVWRCRFGDPRRVIVFSAASGRCRGPSRMFLVRCEQAARNIFRRGGVRIFLEKNGARLPRRSRLPSLSASSTLIERLLKTAGVSSPSFPWPWKLVFVENAEFHGRSLARIPQKACPRPDRGVGYRFCEQNTRKN